MILWCFYDNNNDDFNKIDINLSKNELLINLFDKKVCYEVYLENYILIPNTLIQQFYLVDKETFDFIKDFIELNKV